MAGPLESFLAKLESMWIDCYHLLVSDKSPTSLLFIEPFELYLIVLNLICLSLSAFALLRYFLEHLCPKSGNLMIS